MGTTVSVGGGNRNIPILGDGTVIAGGGNDTITIDGMGKVIVGSGNDKITVFGSSTITAGNGNDSIDAYGGGSMHLGNGNDTINLGFGNDTIFTTGHATVHGVFGSATVTGGSLAFTNTPLTHIEDALSGSATLVGGAFSNEFIGGTGKTVMKGGLGNDTFIGGSGNETMTGGAGHNLFAFVGDAGGTHIITNFVPGHDQLYLEGNSLAALTADITHKGGNTYIHLDGGKTTIELVGVTSLTSADITKKPPGT